MQKSERYISSSVHPRRIPGIFSGIFLVAIMLFQQQTVMAQEGQRSSAIEKACRLITKQSLRQTVTSLADPELRGRESGTDGAVYARGIITDAFYDSNIGMKGQTYLYGFYYCKGNEKVLGANAIGYIPADSSIENPKTVVIGAHYDHLGVLAGRIYPGADNNASGVAALIEIGKAMAALSSEGFHPGCNICLVAFDGKELDFTGSSTFLGSGFVPKSEISLMINLDQIGTTLAPPKQAQTDGLLPKNYLLFLGMDNVGEEVKAAFEKANSEEGQQSMILDFTYYSNSQVNDMLYKMGDQYVFHQAGIPAMAITSGIHKYTNKIADRPDIINFNALTERCRLIFKALVGLTEVKK